MNALTKFPARFNQPPSRAKQKRSDQQFLPATLEILDTPPSPVGIWLIWIICTLAVAGLTWAYFGRIDVVAVAQGKIQPTGHVKVIQPLDTGRVGSLLVENGQHVVKGQILVTLDSGEPDSDVKQLLAELNAYKAEAARRKAGLDALADRIIEPIPDIAFPTEIPDAIKQRETEVLAGDLHKLESTIEGLMAQRSQKQREGDRFAANAAALNDLVATLQSSVDMRAMLRGSGSGSKIDLIKATSSLQEQKVALATAKGQVAESAAAVDVLSQGIEDAYRTFLAENLQKRSEAEREIDGDIEKLAKARVRQSRMVLTSPIDGTVSGLSITTVGQVVGAGEECMRIVPNSSDGNGAGIEIEAYLQNRDIGFIREGQSAIVKVESLPFTRYGTVDATLTKVASDAIPEPDAAQREADPSKSSNDRGFSGAQRTQNLVFPATFRLKTTSMIADGGSVSLSPGMAVTVEIKTGSRRIIDYLFSPLAEVASEAIRER